MDAPVDFPIMSALIQSSALQAAEAEEAAAALEAAKEGGDTEAIKKAEETLKKVLRVEKQKRRVCVSINGRGSSAR